MMLKMTEEAFDEVINVNLKVCPQISSNLILTIKATFLFLHSLLHTIYMYLLSLLLSIKISLLF